MGAGRPMVVEEYLVRSMLYFIVVILDWKEATLQSKSVHRFDSKIPQYHKPINLGSVASSESGKQCSQNLLAHTLMLPVEINP